MKQSIIFAIVAILAVAPAMAGKQAIELAPLDNRADWGMAQISEQARGQLFQVRADVSLRDGTKLIVAIELEDRDGDRAWYDVAFMQVQLGTASVKLDSNKHISPAFPVDSILGVQVRLMNGHTCLSGSFAEN